jgi:hypothetical protein
VVQVTYGVQVIDVEEDLDPREEELHLVLDRRRLVLARAPDVRVEHVPVVLDTIETRARMCQYRVDAKPRQR